MPNFFLNPNINFLIFLSRILDWIFRTTVVFLSSLLLSYSLLTSNSSNSSCLSMSTSLVSSNTILTHNSLNFCHSINTNTFASYSVHFSVMIIRLLNARTEFNSSISTSQLCLINSYIIVRISSLSIWFKITSTLAMLSSIVVSLFLTLTICVANWLISATTPSYIFWLLVSRDNSTIKSYLMLSSLTCFILMCNLPMNVACVSKQSNIWINGLLEFSPLFILSYLCFMFNWTRLSFASMNSLCFILY